MDEELIEQIREADGANDCGSCPFIHFSEYRGGGNCGQASYELDYFLLDEEYYYYNHRCKVISAKFCYGGDVVEKVIQKINAEELIKNYVKDHL